MTGVHALQTLPIGTRWVSVIFFLSIPTSEFLLIVVVLEAAVDVVQRVDEATWCTAARSCASLSATHSANHRKMRHFKHFQYGPLASMLKRGEPALKKRIGVPQTGQLTCGLSSRATAMRLNSGHLRLLLDDT